METDIPTKSEPTREGNTQCLPEMEVEAKPKLEANASPMEVEIKTETSNKTDSSKKGRRQTETISPSSSSAWSQSSSARTELTQRSENLVEMTRTVVRLKNLQRQMAVNTEQYMAKMAKLQKQQEECSAILWRQQQLQGELQAKYAEVIPQEISSNG